MSVASLSTDMINLCKGSNKWLTCEVNLELKWWGSGSGISKKAKLCGCNLAIHNHLPGFSF